MSLQFFHDLYNWGYCIRYMLSTYVLLILVWKWRSSSMGSNRNTTIPTRHMPTICIYTFHNKCVSLILPLELRCKPCVIYSFLTIVPVSVTLIWDISHLIRALSSRRFILLTLLFIHGLSYLLRRLTNPTFVLLVLFAMKLRYLSIEQPWFISRLFLAPPTVKIWSCLVRSLPCFLPFSTTFARGAFGFKILQTSNLESRFSWSHLIKFPTDQVTNRHNLQHITITFHIRERAKFK